MTPPTSRVEPDLASSVADYAHAVVAAQYQQILKHEKKVLADRDPEHLHHMRVGTRRLRVALQVFEGMIELPRAAGAKRLRDLARTLGALRDLDVQQVSLQQDYYPHLEQSEQKHLDRALKQLQQQRKAAFTQVKAALNQPRYQKLKAAYDTWLAQPQYSAIAQLPLATVLPDLLSPLLASLLLHPAWLLPTAALTRAEAPMHDLRKACKRVRYQAEFFQACYGPALTTWLDELKQVQEILGQVHDGQVLLQVLNGQDLSQGRFPGVQQAIAQQQATCLTQWEPLRQQYLDPAFRHHLRSMILQVGSDRPRTDSPALPPAGKSPASGPKPAKSRKPKTPPMSLTP